MNNIFSYIVRKSDNFISSATQVEQELNELGRLGWELVSVVRGDRYTNHYFKKTINIVENIGPR